MPEKGRPFPTPGATVADGNRLTQISKELAALNKTPGRQWPHMSGAVAKCRVRAILRSPFGPGPGLLFIPRKNRKYGETIMHLDIVLLVVLAGLAVLTEIDKLWRRRNNERL